MDQERVVQVLADVRRDLEVKAALPDTDPLDRIGLTASVCAVGEVAKRLGVEVVDALFEYEYRVRKAARVIEEGKVTE